ncbi:MAG: hypothetical protein WCP96_11410 [Methylococcaceae bacterium]
MKKEITSLDWLAVKVISMLRTHGFDAPYIEDKELELAGKNRFEVLLWCNNLDQNSIETLADELGVDPDDFRTTVKTLTRL